MSEPKSNRFADPVVWLVVFVFALLLYVFAYPVVLVLIWPWVDYSGLIVELLRLSAAPLSWLVQNVPAYETYVNYLYKLILN